MSYMSDIASEEELYGYEIWFTEAYGQIISRIEYLEPGLAGKALQQALKDAETRCALDDMLANSE